ncbi:MAG: MBL fold metallo-hydrolase [Deltaproteobacteria bacterium]|nr:MBL fold metallo-hydrolase [Deltaproteobacteria bacterium]
MIKESAGKISDELYALGSPALPAYLLVGKTPVLFDAGMTFMGPLYLRELKEHLGDANRLAYCFLTHSHYDHCGAAPFLKANIPGLKIAASSLAGEIFRRPNAVQLIQSLSQSMEEANRAQIGDADVTFRGLELDRTLEEGDEIVLEDGNQIQVIATPGHTRDAVSYYLPRLKALVGGEAVGSFDRNFDVHPVFLSSHGDYLSSLEKLSKLEINLLMLGHFYYLTEGAQTMIAKAIEATKTFGRRIEEELNSLGGDQEAVVKKIFKKDYVEERLIKQEERPFLINLKAQVKAVAEGK